MGKYRTLGTFFDRIYRNDLNANFNDIEIDINATKTGLDGKIDEQKTRVDNLIVGTAQPSEVVDARGAYAVLRDRLDYTDKKIYGIVNVKEFGAVGDGVTDDTAAIQAAADSVVASGGDARLYMPRGLYKITGKIVIRCALDADQATIQYYGTGTALVIGDDSAPNKVTFRRSFRLPRVINMSRGTNGWDGTSEGVKCVNLNTCHVYVPFIQDFEKGLIVYGFGGGIAYTTFDLGALWENHKNLVLDCDSTGYTNQNLFLNGRLQHSTTKGAVLDDMNASQIYAVTSIPETGITGANNNTFLNTSFEGENVAYYRVSISGRYNHFYNCRWEAPNGVTPRIRYTSTANYNKIDGGYNAPNIVEVFETGALGGQINDYVGAYIDSYSTAGQIVPNNVWTNITGWETGTTRRASYTSSSGSWLPRAGRWRINATAMFVGNSTGGRQLRIVCGGSVQDVDSKTPNTSNQVTLKSSATFRFDGSQTFEIQVQQTSGADLALNASKPFVKLEAQYLGY